MKRSNQILAGAVAGVFAASCLVSLFLVPEAPNKWLLVGFGLFGVMSIYNFAPYTMSDFLRDARETANDVREEA
jgi:hypothetical protein